MPPLVTRCFLLTDIEDSTGLWTRAPKEFGVAIERHHAAIRAAIAQHRGEEMDVAGDGFCIAFTNERDAVQSAITAQRALAAVEWPAQVGRVVVRMGLHRGEVEVRTEGGYRGLTINHTSRVRDAAHGGQVLCTRAVAKAIDGVCGQRDLGRYKLRGLPAPVRLVQLSWAEMQEQEFPPPNARPAHAHNLPPAFTRFFGRAREIARLREWLLAPVAANARAGQLVTLTGPGGTGKTRLGLAVAEAVLADFAGAVWFVPLADIFDARLLAAKVRDALRIDPEATEDALEQIVAMLEPDPALIVFDNFEQLGQDGAAFLHTLLTRLPRLRCVVTTRQRLALGGEREFPVPPLPVPRSVETAALRENESVQLFVDRAQSVRTEFALTERNADAVAELCRRLEGVPLALELAAARADVATPREIVAQLGERLDAFAATDPTVPARQRTLRAAIDWSYGFLPAPLQQFFANLSVFRGGWTAPAAEAAAAFSALGETSANVLRALGELRACSLVAAEDDGETMRFRMLETLRQYAAERLAASASAEDVRIRHAEYFRALAEEAEGRWNESDQALWLDRLELEHDNLRAALAAPLPVGSRLSFATALHQFWLVRGHLLEGRACLSELLGHPADEAEREHARATSAAGMLAWMSGDFAAARPLFNEALAFFRRIDDRANIAVSLAHLGILAGESGEPAEARERFEESLAFYPQEDTDGRRALTQCNLGTALIDLGEWELARCELEAALSTLQARGHRYGVSHALQNLAHLHLAGARASDARALLHECLEIRRELGDCTTMGSLASSLAAAEWQLGEPRTAAMWLGAADTAAERFGVRLNAEAAAKYEHCIAQVRAALKEEDFTASWREGQSLMQQWAR